MNKIHQTLLVGFLTSFMILPVVAATTTSSSPPSTVTPALAPVPAPTTTTPPAVTPVDPNKVDINTADVYTLQRMLDGVGEKKARAIVKFREEHGPYKTVYDLSQVFGIGEKIIETNKNRIVVSEPQGATAPTTATPPPITPTGPAGESAVEEPTQPQE